MTCSDYRRARSPDQKAERAELLVHAARALLDAGTPPAALSLTELAARAGMAKSNIYRYFDSREAILLAILADDALAWVDAIVGRLVEVDPGAPAPARLTLLLDVTLDETLARPRLCELLSVLPSVLEHNVGLETVVAFKLGSAAAQDALVAAAARVVPELGAAGHATWLRHAITLVVGGWPLAHPPAVARQAVAQTGLERLTHALDRDLREAVHLIGAGLLARPAAPG